MSLSPHSRNESKHLFALRPLENHVRYHDHVCYIVPMRCESLLKRLTLAARMSLVTDMVATLLVPTARRTNALGLRHQGGLTGGAWSVNIAHCDWNKSIVFSSPAPWRLGRGRHGLGIALMQARDELHRLAGRPTLATDEELRMSLKQRETLKKAAVKERKATDDQS